MIKFVYFDIGGVLIKDFSDDTDKWESILKEIGVKRELYNQVSDLFCEYEKNELCTTRSVDSLIPIFSKKFDINFPKDFSFLEYNLDHFGRNPSIWPIVKKAKQNYNIGLLTNMYVKMLDGIKEKKLLPPVDWDVIIDSSVVKLRKPDIQIFKIAQEKSGFKNSEIFFIDNSIENVKAAKDYGWNAYRYNPVNPRLSNKELLRILF